MSEIQRLRDIISESFELEKTGSKSKALNFATMALRSNKPFKIVTGDLEGAIVIPDKYKDGVWHFQFNDWNSLAIEVTPDEAMKEIESVLRDKYEDRIEEPVFQYGYFDLSGYKVSKYLAVRKAGYLE